MSEADAWCRQVFHSRLSPNARLVGLALASLGCAAAPRQVSLTDIQASTGLARSTVAKFLNELEAGGYIIRERKRDPHFGHITTTIGMAA